MALKPSNRVIEVDKKFDVDKLDGQTLQHHVFTRVSGLKVRFVRVDFRFSTFDTCYLRDCVFDCCDFTGCRFTNANFHGSSFTGCKFDYASFEKTLVDSEILDTCCPSFNNVKARFARSLRINYQSIGDAASANKAVLVELDATAEHLWKSWRSNESYYRRKYQGWRRFHAFLSWGSFALLDFVWGNGERPLRLVRTVAILLGFMAIADASLLRDPKLVHSYLSALMESPQVFLGVGKAGESYPGLLLAVVTFTRLTVFSLFMSILVRRLSQR